MSTPALSFSPQTFQKLSPASYLLRHLQSTPPLRPSGRRAQDFRQPSLHTNSLSHAHGSAVVRTGDTAVVCGIRGEVLSLSSGIGGDSDEQTKGKIVVLRSGEQDPKDGEIRSRNLVVINLEMGTGCSRDYHPGPPTDFAQGIAARLHRLFHSPTSLVSPETLRILDVAPNEIKAYWVLYVDVLCISLDGNVLDAAWASIVAALYSTRLPRAYWDPDGEEVVCYPEKVKAVPVEVNGLAFTASFAVLGTTSGEEEGEGGAMAREGDEDHVVILNDPDEFEERVCDVRVKVCIKEGGEIGWIEHGGGLVEMRHITECVRRAMDRYKVWEKLLKQVARPK